MIFYSDESSYIYMINYDEILNYISWFAYESCGKGHSITVLSFGYMSLIG